MSYQKCPNCMGSGIDPQTSIHTMNTSQTCTVCNGKKIISSLTGLPPKEVISKSNLDINKGIPKQLKELWNRVDSEKLKPNNSFTSDIIDHNCDYIGAPGGDYGEVRSKEDIVSSLYSIPFPKMTKNN